MSIFLNSVLEHTGHGNQNFNVPVYEGYINPETEGLSQIMQEALMENYAIQSSLLVMDAVNYSMVTEGQDSIVTENAVSSIFKKMKEAWLKLWSKVTAWFKSSIENIKVFFMDGEKFVKTYKNELLRVDTKGFKYNGYKWTNSKGSSTVNTFISKASDSLSKATSDFSVTNPDVEKENITSTEYMEDMVFKALGVDNVGDMKKAIDEDYRDGDDKPSEITDVSGSAVKDMIHVVEGTAKVVKKIEKEKKEMDKVFKDSLKVIDNASKEAAKNQRDTDMSTETGRASNKKYSKIISNATALDSIAKNVQSIMASAITSEIQNERAMHSEFVRVLKKLRNFKAVTEATNVAESFNGDNNDSFSAIFESMR